MPQSKKDLRTQKQKKNVEAGIGDAKGRIASNIKVSSHCQFTGLSFTFSSLKLKFLMLEKIVKWQKSK